MLIRYAWLLLLSACSAPPMHTLEGVAQGTTYHIRYWSKNPVDEKAIAQLVQQELDRLDAAISNYRRDSLLEQFNAQHSTQPQPISAEIVDLVEYTRQVSIASDGCYDVTVKPAWDLWGFKGDQLTIPDAITLQAALARVGMAKIERVDATHLRKLQPDVQIDFSSIGQGYSVARVAAVLEQQQIDNYLVEIGGEIQVRGTREDRSAWHVAIEKPLIDERALQEIVAVNRAESFSVITSGTYRHYFDEHGKRYSHILDARTGKPIEHSTTSVTVLDDNAKVAGTWATALLCLGAEQGVKVADAHHIAAIFIDQQGNQLLQVNSAKVAGLRDVAFMR